MKIPESTRQNLLRYARADESDHGGYVLTLLALYTMLIDKGKQTHFVQAVEHEMMMVYNTYTVPKGYSS